MVLSDGESDAAGTLEANRLMTALGIGAAQTIEGAYVDLLEARKEAR